MATYNGTMMNHIDGGSYLDSVYNTNKQPRQGLGQVVQMGLQAMELGGYVKILNHTGLMARWARGRLPLDPTPASYVFVKDPKFPIWAQYVDTMGEGHNSSAAAKRCVRPSSFDVPGGYQVLSNQSNVQSRIMTAFRNDAAYMIQVVDAHGTVLGAFSNRDVNMYA